MSYRSGVVLLAVEGPSVPELIVTPLRDLGYRVVRARDAQIAISLAGTLETLDIVIADASSFGIDGPALVAALRERWPGLPAIYVTEDRVLAGRDEVIVGPFSAAEIVHRVIDLAGRRRSKNDRAEVLRDRLMARLETPMLKDAYGAWLRAGERARVPRISTLGTALSAQTDHVFVASVRADPRGEATFRFLAVGAALSGLLGSPLEGTALLSSDDDMIGTLTDAYRRAVRTHLPSYEYLRYRFADSPQVTLERLLLPASNDGHTVTHLFGLVSIVGRDGVPADMEIH